MLALLLTVHVFVAVVMILLILLQQGKGADAGASFGSGASGTVFGAAGSGNFLTRLTAILAAIFFATSLTLSIVSNKKAQADALPEVNQTISAPAPTTQAK